MKKSNNKAKKSKDQKQQSFTNAKDCNNPKATNCTSATEMNNCTNAADSSSNCTNEGEPYNLDY